MSIIYVCPQCQRSDGLVIYRRGYNADLDLIELQCICKHDDCEFSIFLNQFDDGEKVREELE